MDFEDDKFPSSLPPFQSSPHVFHSREMNDSFEDAQDEFFDSPGYPYGSFLDQDFPASIGQKTPHHAPQASASAQPESSLSNGFVRNSPSTSLDTSDSSSGGLSTADRMAYANSIHIPADLVDSQDHWEANQLAGNHQNNEYTVNQWFDIDSAAGSPTNPEDQLNQKGYNLTHNLTHRPALGFGLGDLDQTPPMTKIGALKEQARRNDQQTISGPQIENVWNTQGNTGMIPDRSTQLPSPRGSYTAGSDSQEHVDLQISTLPRTQRVETQMHVTLTLSKLPPKIDSIRFQKYALARQKLLKKDSKSSPSTLELYAHCVCDTAMRDPAKRQRAFEHAALISCRRNHPGSIGESSPRDDYTTEPLEGGFVTICAQCIQRETKRASRKKQEDEGHEEWLKDQPKRIIVFNRDELMEWKDWRSMDDGRNSGSFADTAVQIRFPMRIQCYSRHHNDKDGYRVIFTIKDFDDRLIAQAMSSPSTITDDHKAQTQSSKSPTETAVRQPEISSAKVSPVTSALISSRTTNLNRNSYSTPDLSRLPYTQHHQQQQQNHNPRANWRSGRPPSLHGSRPASPTMPSGHHNKKRKGSGVSHTRIRSDLAMTPFHRNTPRSPPSNMGYLAGLPQSMAALSYNPTVDHPASVSVANSNPSTPGGFNPSFHQRSHSVENFFGFGGTDSVVSSAWHSQAPSAESSPQPYGNPIVQPQSLTKSLDVSPLMHSPTARPMLHKVTPTEGPALGGIEVTCLGDGFTPKSRVYFGDIPAAQTSFWSPAALVCTLPASASPCFVHVTIRNPSETEVETPSHEQIFFQYTDNNEETMMRSTLALLHEQFTGGSIEAREFTQKLLSSFGTQEADTSMTNFMPQIKSEGQYNVPHIEQPNVFRDVEDAILSCLELIDLDEKANQVDINRKNATGHSILHLAAYLNYYRITAGLLARGAEINIRDHNGLTPIHLASLRGNTKIIRKLRSSGADTALRSLDGRRPSDLIPIQQGVDEGKIESRFASRATAPLRSNQSNGTTAANRTLDVQSAENGYSKSRIKLSLGSGTGPETEAQAVPGPPVTASRTINLATETNEKTSQLAQDLVRSETAIFATHPAVSAWKDQLSAQIQQLQQNLQRALPLMPTLPDYQAYPVMRRISNLVPQRIIKAEEGINATRKLKEADYNWWDLFTGPNILPPAYEEIYPSRSTQGSELEQLKQHSDGMQGPPPDPSDHRTSDDQCVLGKVDIASGHITKEQQDRIRQVHARQVKRLSNDRKLFFIWIPLLLIISMAILLDPASDLVRLGSQTRDFVRQQIRGQGDHLVRL